MMGKVGFLTLIGNSKIKLYEKYIYFKYSKPDISILLNRQLIRQIK